MDSRMRVGPMDLGTGFDFPPYNVMCEGSVVESVEVLRSALAFRVALVGAKATGAIKGLDSMLTQEFLRFAATGSTSWAEARAKASLLDAAMAPNGPVTARPAKAMLNAAVGFESNYFDGRLGPSASFTPSRIAAAKRLLAGAASNRVPPDQEKAVFAVRSAVRLRGRIADASSAADGAALARSASIQPSEAVRSSLSRLIAMAERGDRNLEAYVGHGDGARGFIALMIVNDLALTIASCTPASRREAEAAVSYLFGHLCAFGSITNLSVMLATAVDLLCTKWDIDPPEAPTPQPPARTH